MKKNDKKKWMIVLGFIVEILLFILTGVFLAYGSLICILIFIAAISMAFKVGSMIRNQAIGEIKE